MSKLFLNYFYATFKQWLQEVKSLYTYSSLIRLIPNFYDMCIMYLQTFYEKIILFIYLFIFVIQSSKN
jgi:hypothetical protein